MDLYHPEQRRKEKEGREGGREGRKEGKKERQTARMNQSSVGVGHYTCIIPALEKQ